MFVFVVRQREGVPATAPATAPNSASASTAHADSVAPSRGTTADMAASIAAAAAKPVVQEFVEYTTRSGEVLVTDVPKLGYEAEDISSVAQRVRTHTLMTDRFILDCRAYKESGDTRSDRSGNLLAKAIDAIKLRPYAATKPALVTNQAMRLGLLHSKIRDDAEVCALQWLFAPALALPRCPAPPGAGSSSARLHAPRSGGPPSPLISAHTCAHGRPPTRPS